jgi:glycosyltransferase involved in cell wall biosynthesis
MDAPVKEVSKGEPRATVVPAAELDNLAQETERLLLCSEAVEQAQSTQLLHRQVLEKSTLPMANGPPAQRLFIDVTRCLEPDLPACYDSFRLERYVIQYLAQDSTLSLDLVTYDRIRQAYRLLSLEEKTSLAVDRQQRQCAGASQTSSVEEVQMTGATRRSRRALGPMMADLYRRLSGAAFKSGADQDAASRAAEQPAIDHDAPFRSGDVLLCTTNLHEYMDYAYLARLREETGVRIIGVLRDVTSTSLPFLIPAPAHEAHQHWVEIGHLSECLIAPSHFSRESYNLHIAKPNDIDVRIRVAPLPNLLRGSPEGIEGTPVPELEGRAFIVYRSTIEARRNHVLALHLWDELQRRLPSEALPMLVFVGEWGWGVESVQRLIEGNWRLRPHVRVFPRLSNAETRWLYRNARFSIFPSLVEDSGHVASESLFFGTPVIVSTCPSLLEATERLMPAFHPHDFLGWLRELERSIVDDGYLANLREAAARYRGPAHEAFAATIRDAISPPQKNHSPRTGPVPSEYSAP